MLRLFSQLLVSIPRLCISGVAVIVTAQLLPQSYSQAEATDENLIHLRYAPHWIPQSQFAGFYLAKDLGFYEEEGLDVTILRGGPENPATARIEDGNADAATLFLSQAIPLRAKGVPLVLVAQLLQESSLLLVSKKETGIKDPSDLNGKKVTVWPDFRAQPEALFEKFNVDPEILQQGSSVGLLQWGGADAVCAMRYNEYVRLYLMGFEPEELVVIEFESHEVGFPEDGIYFREDFLEKHPEASDRFVRASLRGWREAFANPEAAVDAVMKRITAAGLSSNRAHQSLMLEALRPVYSAALDSEAGTLLPKSGYEQVARSLLETGLVDQIPEWEDFHP